MSVRRRQFAIFVLGTIIGVIALSCIWSVFAPVYNHILAASTNIANVSNATLTVEDESIVIASQHDGIIVQWAMEGSSLQYGLIVLIALVAATPGLTLRQRPKFVLLAAVLLFAVHIGVMMGMSYLVQSMNPTNPSLSDSPMETLLTRVGFDLFPILIWAGLTFKYWFRKSQAEAHSKPKLENTQKPRSKQRRVAAG